MQLAEIDLRDWFFDMVAIRVENESDAIAFCAHLNDTAMEYKTYVEFIPMQSSMWDLYKENTCYAVTTGEAYMMFCGPIDVFENAGYKIVSLDDMRYEMPDIDDCGSSIETLFE